MITLEQAKTNRLCRICGRPIDYPATPGITLESEDSPCSNRGEKIVFRNGAEFAHSGCIFWDKDAPWGPENN